MRQKDNTREVIVKALLGALGIPKSPTPLTPIEPKFKINTDASFIEDINIEADDINKDQDIPDAKCKSDADKQKRLEGR